MTTEKSMIGKIGVLVLGLGLLSAPAWAVTDYGSMTNEELAAMRGTMRDVSPEDQANFRAVWQERVKSMDPEQRRDAVSRPDNALRDGKGDKNRQGARAGSGQGKQYRQGPADGTGNGNQIRQRLQDGSGGGSQNRMGRGGGGGGGRR